MAYGVPMLRVSPPLGVATVSRELVMLKAAAEVSAIALFAVDVIRSRAVVVVGVVTVQLNELPEAEAERSSHEPDG